jgi:hypothetical protein
MNLLDTFTNEVKQGWQDAKHDLTRDYTQEELNKRHKKVLATMFGSDVANGSVERDPKYRDYGGGVEAEDGGSGYDYVMDYKDYIKLPKADSSNTISSEPSKNSKDLGSFGGATQGQETTSIVTPIQYPIGATKGEGWIISGKDVRKHIQTAKLHNIIDGKDTADTPYQTQYSGNEWYKAAKADDSIAVFNTDNPAVSRGFGTDSKDGGTIVGTGDGQKGSVHSTTSSSTGDNNQKVGQVQSPNVASVRSNDEIVKDIIGTIATTADNNYDKRDVDYVLNNKYLRGTLESTAIGKNFLEKLEQDEAIKNNGRQETLPTFIDESDIDQSKTTKEVDDIPLKLVANGNISGKQYNKLKRIPTEHKPEAVQSLLNSEYKHTQHSPVDADAVKSTNQTLPVFDVNSSSSTRGNNINKPEIVSAVRSPQDAPEKDIAKYISEVGENYPQTPKRGEAVLDVEMEYLGDLGHTFGNMTPKEAATTVRNYYVSEKGTKDLINKLKYVVPKSTTDYLETQLKVGNLKPSKKQQDRNEVISALIKAEGSYKYGYSWPAIQTAKNYLQTNGSDPLIEQALKNMEYNKKKFSEYEKRKINIPRDMEKLAIINFDEK